MGEGDWTHGQMLLLENGVKYTSKNHEEILLVCLNVTRSVKGSQEGQLVPDLSTPMYLVAWAMCLQIICGDVEASGKYKV